MTLRPVLAAVGLVVFASAASPTAQARRPMTLIELAEIPRVLDVQLSPDGRFVSYMLQRADWNANRQVPHIWTQAVGGGPSTQITSSAAGETLARWSPDGKSLLFTARADNRSQIFVVPSAGGQPRPLSRHATGVYGGAAPSWSPDGASIYFLADDPQTDIERNRDRLHDDVYPYEENFKQRHLWKVSVSDGLEQKLTDGDFSVLSFRLSRDGRHIAHHRAPTPLADDNYRGEVWTVDGDGRNARSLTGNGVEEMEAELSPDNTQLLFLAEANERLEPYYCSTLFIVPATGGTPRQLLAQFPYAIEHAAWASDGKSILAVVNMGAHSELFRIDVVARTAKPLTDGRHSVQFWSFVSAADRMVFQLDEPTRLGDAWILQPDSGAPIRVTNVYDSLDRDFLLPRQEKISWPGSDGATIEGLLFYPVPYEPGRRYPLVVQLHGGPQESDKFGYGPGVIVNYVPILTARGYAVFRPNYRGSTGYGNAFLRDVVGKYFNNMHLDVLAGVDLLVRQGLADPDRLAVMGWSAGGHLTNKLVTVTNRFKAAASAAGVANWTSLFAQTDTRSSRSVWFGGTPWQKNAPAAAFWDNSPLKDAANIKTPTLLIAGQDDARVPLAQAVEMFRALKENGVPTKLYVAPREQHQWGELRHQIYKANAELEWFEKYVTGRVYTWERAPGDAAAAGNAAR
jgi:dipeptidyl aminopeptidase/acylaminoacyl peptidase